MATVKDQSTDREDTPVTDHPTTPSETTAPAGDEWVDNLALSAPDQLLAAAPAHLILDLQPVSFLGSSGLSCLLHARELSEQTTGTQLHLAGLVARVVARPLQVTGLAARFDTYPTLTEALAALARREESVPSRWTCCR